MSNFELSYSVLHVQLDILTPTFCIITIFFSCRLFKVNGQPIFIRGGNWILSDGLLRLSKKRYSTDIKFHADMNFNMLRCWAGGLAERPEFYYYCDLYGLLVIPLYLFSALIMIFSMHSLVSWILSGKGELKMP